MKKITENKYILVGLTLLAGILIGYFMSGPNNRQSSNDNQQASTSNNQQIKDVVEEIWTCSMHPQIKQHEPGDCPICGMDLIPVSNNKSTNSNPLVYEMSPEAVAMANINTTLVTGVTSEGKLLLSGKVEADEQRQASISAKFPGRIEQLYVNFTGEVVQKGEKLVSIYSPELLTAQKELLLAASSKASYPELYEAARKKLRLWKLNENQIEKIENSGEVRERFDLFADRSGVVTQLNVAVGDYVNTGSVLFNVVDLSSVWIMMDAFESDLPYVHVGDEVAFTVAGVPGKTFNAKVNYIDPVINPDTRAASVRAEIANPDGVLKPEMFVSAEIKASTPTGQASLAIPRTALLWSGKRSIVYVKVPDATYPSYEMREISIGSRMGDMWLVESGLEAGEEVVTNGVFAIDAAAQLSGNYSMLNRPEIKTLEVPQAFKEQITAVADAYFEIKEALVKSDANEAKSASEMLQIALSKVNFKSLDEEALNLWRKLNGQMDTQADVIEKATKLEDMRHGFSTLSESVLEMTEYFGLQKEKLYKSYCPMAFNNQGAYWLSEVEDVRNPYFGDAMLNCGEVKETYIEGQPVFENESSNQQKSPGVHKH